MDLRIKRTRLFIRNAFFDLIREKGFDGVTIGDITERAMINRSTFYRHFKDKYDLAERCLDEPFDHLMQAIMERREGKDKPENLARMNFEMLLKHVEENVDLYKILYGETSNPIFIKGLRRYIIRILRFRFGEVSLDEHTSVIPLNMYEAYLAGAYIGVIQWWLEEIPAYSAEMVADWLYRLVAEGSVAALGITR